MGRLSEYVNGSTSKGQNRNGEVEVYGFIETDELEGYDLIYYMDASNARYLRRLFGNDAAKCQRLLQRDVADPWYTGDFAQTWADILEGCSRILEENT